MNWRGAVAYVTWAYRPTSHPPRHFGVQSTTINRQHIEYSMQYLVKLVVQLRLRSWFSYLTLNVSRSYIIVLMFAH